MGRANGSDKVMERDLLEGLGMYGVKQDKNIYW
jgi:hypothetical protein